MQISSFVDRRETSAVRRQTLLPKQHQLSLTTLKGRSGKRRFSLCLTGRLTELTVHAHSHFKSRDLKFTSKCAKIANFTRGYLQTLLLCSKSVKVFELSEPNKCTVLIKRWKRRGRSTSFSPRPIITSEQRKLSIICRLVGCVVSITILSDRTLFPCSTQIHLSYSSRMFVMRTSYWSFKMLFSHPDLLSSWAFLVNLPFTLFITFTLRRLFITPYLCLLQDPIHVS